MASQRARFLDKRFSQPWARLQRMAQGRQQVPQLQPRWARGGGMACSPSPHPPSRPLCQWPWGVVGLQLGGQLSVGRLRCIEWHGKGDLLSRPPPFPPLCRSSHPPRPPRPPPCGGCLPLALICSLSLPELLLFTPLLLPPHRRRGPPHPPPLLPYPPVPRGVPVNLPLPFQLPRAESSPPLPPPPVPFPTPPPPQPRPQCRAQALPRPR